MITIPVEAHLLTLTVSKPEIVEKEIRVGRETRKQKERVMVRREIATTRDAASLAASFLLVNKIYAPAGIVFRLGKTKPSTIEAPDDTGELDDPGFLMLAKSYPMRGNCISLMLVHKFRGSEGGASKEDIGVCAVGDDAPENAFAHEFGHLLGLGHQGDIRDLMNAGMSVPGAPLTPTEITAVQASALYKRFSAP